MIITLLIAAAFTGLFYLVHLNLLATLWVAVGLVIGYGFLLVDEHFLYRLYAETTQTFLITRSPLFWLAYVPLALYVTTSSGSWIGSGLVLGIGLGLVVEMFQLYRQPEVFEQRFLTQIKRPLTPTEIQRLVIVAILFVLVLAGIILW